MGDQSNVGLPQDRAIRRLSTLFALIAQGRKNSNLIALIALIAQGRKMNSNLIALFALIAQGAVREQQGSDQ